MHGLFTFSSPVPLMQGFSNGMPEQPDMLEVIFNLAVMHGGIQTYSTMQRLYLEVCSSRNTTHGLQLSSNHALLHEEAWLPGAIFSCLASAAKFQASLLVPCCGE